MFTPSLDEMNEIAEPQWLATADGASTVLATLPPSIRPRARGICSWAKQAIVTVTAGRSSAQRVSSTAVLLREAGITIRSGVLIGADAQDDSIGLLQPNAPLVGLPAADGVISA